MPRTRPPRSPNGTRGSNRNMAGVALGYHSSTHQQRVSHNMAPSLAHIRMKPRLALLVIVLVVVARFIPFDVARVYGIKGDEATYVAMALSLAYDGDLAYRPEDLRRFQNLYGVGPEGVFLKEAYRLRL